MIHVVNVIPLNILKDRKMLLFVQSGISANIISHISIPYAKCQVSVFLWFSRNQTSDVMLSVLSLAVN